MAAIRNGFASAYLFGDANLDGGVDAADLMTIGSGWQRTDVLGWSQADFNADGMINREDLNLLALNWQARTPPANAVPEPVGVLLALLGFVFLIRMGRRVCTGRAIVFLWTAVALVAVSDTDAQFPSIVVAENGPFRLLSTPQIAPQGLLATTISVAATNINHRVATIDNVAITVARNEVTLRRTGVVVLCH